MPAQEPAADDGGGDLAPEDGSGSRWINPCGGGAGWLGFPESTGVSLQGLSANCVCCLPVT